MYLLSKIYSKNNVYNTFIDVGNEYHVLCETFNELFRQWCVSYLHSCIVSCDHISKKFLRKKKVMREFSFSHWNEIHFTATISHDARFSGRRYDILFCLVHHFETQIILWQFFRCNGILSWFFFHILYEKQRKGPFVVGRLYVKVFYRTYHYIWSMVWQHNNTFSTLE